MHNDIEKILLSEETLKARVRELGAQISEDYRDKNPAMVCILKGAIMFYTDLLRSMPDVYKRQVFSIRLEADPCHFADDIMLKPIPRHAGQYFAGCDPVKHRKGSTQFGGTSLF